MEEPHKDNVDGDWRFITLQHRSEVEHDGALKKGTNNEPCKLVYGNLPIRYEGQTEVNISQQVKIVL
ncbi:hypothetical protein QVD17_39637 [Tagetes erecta]|uniref:Uncharacterized protein n=1 Tax=Tagetes erecta TaxID=13708 RepID=A0AAD8JNX0_TARER|nr:hypothetical protein QVD17_39637 [Tagetes erecta]